MNNIKQGPLAATFLESPHLYLLYTFFIALLLSYILHRLGIIHTATSSRKGTFITAPDQDGDPFECANSILIECKHECLTTSLDSAIDLFDRVISKQGPHRPEVLKGLVTVSVMDFVITDDDIKLNKVIMLCRDEFKPVELSEDQRLPKSTDSTEDEKSFSLALIHIEEFRQSIHISRLDASISSFRDACSLYTPSHPRCLDSLYGLATALVIRFMHTGLVQDLDEAIGLHRKVLGLAALSNPSRRRSLNALCAILIQRFIVTGHSADLDDALSIHDAPSVNGNLIEAWALFASANDIRQRFETSQEVSDLDSSILTYRQALDKLPAEGTHRLPVLGNLGGTLRLRFEQTAYQGDLDEAIVLNREALGLIPPGDRNRLVPLVNMTSTLQQRIVLTDQLDDLNEVIELQREVSGLLPSSHPARWSAISNLASALRRRSEKTEQTIDLDESISAYRESLSPSSTSLPERLSTIISFMGVLRIRLGHSGQLADLDEMITLNREILDIPGLNQSTLFDNLGNLLHERFKKTNDLTNLEDAISTHRKALELRPLPDVNRPSSLNNLGSMLDERFQQTNQIEDLDEAVSLHRQALDLWPIAHPDRYLSLCNLGATLYERYEQTTNINDLNQGILLLYEALELLPSSHTGCSALLNNLGASLRARFDQTGQLSDLQETIVLHRAALEMRPCSHPERPSSLSNLAHSLCQLFDQTGQVGNLHEAIALNREALSLRPLPHPDRPGSLCNLGASLHRRFEETGQVNDLDESILMNREALELLPSLHPNRPPSLINLGNALYERYVQTEQGVDLDEAIVLHREALELRPAPHVNRALSLSVLGATLHDRYQLKGQLVDLDESIKLTSEALDLLPAHHPDRPGCLTNLGNALHHHFIIEKQPENLEEAIRLYREALCMQLAPHPDRPATLNHLASTLHEQFRTTGKTQYLDEAIAASRDAIGISPRDHPKNAHYMTRLGSLLVVMYSHTQQTEYLDDATATFRSAVSCETSSAFDRFRAARSWARAAHDTWHQSALGAYQHAVQLLSRLAMLGLDVKSRQKVLMSLSDGLARNAAACAIKSGQLENAIELLEEGRSIFWSQALQLRTPLDNLKSVARDLAIKLEEIGRALEKGSYRDASRKITYSHKKLISLEQEAVHYRRLSDNWNATLEQIRQLTGFHDFLRQKEFSALQSEMAQFPVILLNASTYGCAALIVTKTNLGCVPFPEFTQKIAEELVQSIRTLSGSSHRYHDSGGRHLKTKKPKASEDAFRSLLGTLWKLVVKPIFRTLEMQKSDSPPRVWWCPTGFFAFLPLHAAGIYTVGKNDCVFDYAISSYTPTIKTLRSSTSHGTADATDLKTMVVIQPDTPGYPPLEYTCEELLRIEKHVPSKNLVRLGVPEAPASVQNVLMHLTTASIVHFACHGQQDTKEPLNSAIILADGELKASRIMREPLPNAMLVFLSACQTAMGDETVPDEAIHLAATLLFAGFRAAIATMWVISDVDGPKVSDIFYEHLFTKLPNCPDTSQAARALHLAIAELRSEGCPFERWVPFIHLGV